MFGFLKDKLKKAVGLFTKKVKEKAVEEEVEVEKPVEKKAAPQKPLPKKSVKPKEKAAPIKKEKPVKEKASVQEKKPVFQEEVKTIIQEKEEAEPVQKVQEKPGFFGRLFGKKEEPKIEEKKII